MFYYLNVLQERTLFLCITSLSFLQPCGLKHVKQPIFPKTSTVKDTIFNVHRSSIQPYCSLTQSEIYHICNDSVPNDKANKIFWNYQFYQRTHFKTASIPMICETSNLFFFLFFFCLSPPPQYNMELNVSYRHLLNYYSMHYCYSRDWLKNKNYILLASQDYSAVIEPNSCIQWEYALGLTYTCAMNHVDTLEITAKVRNKCLNFNHLLVRCHFQQIPTSLYKLVIPPYKLYFSHSESWHDWYSALRHKHLWVILRVFLCFVTSFNTKVVLVKNKTHTP